MQCCLYYLAAFAHLIWSDEFTLLIPDYIPNREFINKIVVFLEIIIPTGLLFDNMQRYAALGILALLLVFVLSHVYVIQAGGCIPDSLCVPLWIAWIRLLFIHPLLIFWAFIYTDYGKKYIRDRTTTL